MDILSRLTALARRTTRRPLLTLLVATVATVASVMLVGRLRFNTDLADLLPADHPDLVELRRIQKKQPSDTGFMVLLSRNFLYATDEQGHALVHDGMRWKATPTGAPLYALWGFAVRDVFAAGAKGRVFHWDGKTWQRESSGSDVTLRGLWGRSAGELYAVGGGGAVLRRGADKKWHRVASSSKATLRAVSGNGSVLYAVGDGGTVLRVDKGGVLTAVAVPSKQRLRGVWVAKDGQVFIAGDGGTLLHYDGKQRWRALDSGTRANLNAVWGERPDAVFAVGDRGTALRFDGKRVVKEIFRIDDDMRALHGLRADRIWAVGRHCSLERRTTPVRRERGPQKKWMMVNWWDGPVDSKKEKKSAWPPAFLAPKKPCTRAYSAVWRPPNKMKAIIDFLPRLAKTLLASKLVGRVEYRKPVQFFIDRAFYYASIADLHKIHKYLADRLERETARATGLYVDLDDDDKDKKKDKDEVAELIRKYRASAAQRSEHYQHYDGASVGVLVFPKKGGSDIASLRRLRRELRAIIDKSNYHAVDPLLRVDIGGDGVAKIAEYEATIEDITGLAWLAVAGIVLVLVLYMRRLLALLFVLLPLAMSLTWTFGLTALTIGTLNMVTGFLFAVIFGVGIDYGIQLYGRYREVRVLGLPREEALDQMILGTGRATTTSALTSAAALLTLLITDFRGFSEFGFISGLGVLFALVSFLCVQPALLVLAERFGLLRLAAASDAQKKQPSAPLRAARVVLVVSAAAAVFGVVGTTQLSFEYNHRVLRPTGERSEILHRSDHCFGQSFTPTVMATGSRHRLRAALDAVERTRRRLGDKSAVRRASSILAAVPQRQAEKRVLIAGISKLLHSRRWRLVPDKSKKKIRLEKLRAMSKATPFGVRDLPPSVRRAFHGPGYGDSWLGMVYYGINISDSRQARRLKNQVGKFEGSPMVSVAHLLPDAKVFVEGQRVEVGCGGEAKAVAACRAKLVALAYDGKPVFAQVLGNAQAVAKKLAVEGGLRGDLLAIARPGLVPVQPKLAAAVTPSGHFSASSGELVIAEVVDVMLHDGKIAFVVALLVVFVACWVDFRSIKLAGLACVPLGIGFLWTFGVMYVLGIKLNMFNFVVLPALVGIGIDYGVHFIHRFEEGKESVALVRGALYWVLFFCACTSIVGFGNMALADHPGLRSLGQLAIIGLACIFVAATYTLPGLMGLREKRKRDAQR
ncbi:MAG: MMPL family transporter [Myxococcales bacterium]|nr:MMPL family transporter [Myxococcales bacterium]